MTWRTRGPADENELRALFEEIEAPPSLDRWRERIADVDQDGAEADGATILALPTERELRPTRRRSVAVAAAAAVVIGLAGVVVAGQFLSDAPPADPTMIIDGPDRTRSSPPPTSSSLPPTGSQTAPVTGGAATPDPPGDNQNGGGPGDQQNGGGPGPGGNQVAWPPMVGDPSPSNTGVPVGAVLADHHGDLRVTTPGAVVSDLRITGSVIVDAPDVTLRRVIVVAGYAAPAVRQNASRLSIEDSELSGSSSIAQSAGGLSVRRSRLESGGTLAKDAVLNDNYLNAADLVVSPGTSGVLLRHNVMGRVTLNDFDAPITNVTIENNVLMQVDAPTEPGSASIHVLNNRFVGSAPSTGWNPGAPDYLWSGNTFASSGATANP